MNADFFPSDELLSFGYIRKLIRDTHQTDFKVHPLSRRFSSRDVEFSQHMSNFYVYIYPTRKFSAFDKYTLTHRIAHIAYDLNQHIAYRSSM